MRSAQRGEAGRGAGAQGGLQALQPLAHSLDVDLLRSGGAERGDGGLFDAGA